MAPMAAAIVAAKRRVQRRRRKGPELDLMIGFISVGKSPSGFFCKKQAKSSTSCGRRVIGLASHLAAWVDSSSRAKSRDPAEVTSKAAQRDPSTALHSAQDDRKKRSTHHNNNLTLTLVP